LYLNLLGGYKLANHKSAAKRARQTVNKTLRNSRTKKTVRTFEKRLRSAIAAKNSTEAQTLLKEYTSKIGKAAQKGVVHANTAARKISQLAKQVAKI
jgi:small subunit ribosomal protein S20